MKGGRRLQLGACLFAILVTTFSSGAGAESLSSIFEEGNNAFWNGDYEEAAAKYERLEELGLRDAALSYNLGTAYARLGKLGMAVRHYERGLSIEPDHPDTLHNLNLIREFLARRASEQGRDADLAPGVTAWRAVLDRFSPTSASVGFLIFHLALFFVLILRRFVTQEMTRLSLGVLAGILGILTVTTLTVTIGKWHHANYSKEAVVVAEGALDVMEGPASAVKRFAVEEGSRVTVLEERGDYTHLLDAAGQDGWVESTHLGKI